MTAIGSIDKLVTQLLGTDGAYRLGLALLHSLWQAAAVAALLWVALAALRRHSPGARYVAACAALVLMLLLPVATFRATRAVEIPTGSPAPSQFSPTASAIPDVPRPTDSATAARGVAPPPVDAAPDAGPTVPLPTPTATAPQAVPPHTMAPAWHRWADSTWLAGVFALCVWNAGGWIAVQRLRSVGTAPVAEEVTRRFASMARRVGVSRPVRIVRSALVEVPAVVGWLRPVVLVPAAVLGDLSPAQLDAILAHELAHVLRHDYLVNLLQAVAETLLFYHPAVWWVSHQMRLERELCCDDIAVAACGDRIAYADALASVEGWRGASLALAAAGPGWMRAGVLLGRVRRVLRCAPDDADRPRAAAGLGMIAVAAVGVVLCCVMNASAPRARAVADGPSSPATTRPAGADTAPAAGTTYAGRVLSPAGEPVAGATVSVVAYRGTTRDSQSVIASARSGLDGSFQVRPPKLPSDPANGPSAVHVMVEAAGYGIRGAFLAAPDPSIAHLNDIRLAPATELRVRCVGPDDQPVAGVWVAPDTMSQRSVESVFEWSLMLPAEARQRLGRKTDAEGMCVLSGLAQNANVRLWIDDDRFAQVASTDFIALSGEAVTTAPPVRLRPAGSIRGRVVYAGGGGPAAGVRVHASSTDPRGGGWGEAVTDEKGEYQIGRLLPTRYNLIAMLGPELEKEWTAAALERLTVAEGQRVGGQDLTLIKGALITGKVVLKDTGRGVPAAAVGLQGPSRPRAGGIVRTVTGPDGSFTFRVPPGAQYLYLQEWPPEGYLRPEPIEPSVADGQTLAVTLELPRDPSPPLGGRVVDAEGKPVAGASVIADPPKGDLTGLRPARTDADGRFKFAAVPPGSRVRARKGDLATVEAAVVRGGEDDLTLRLQSNTTASLVVTVMDTEGKPVKGALVRLTVWTGEMGTSPNDPRQVTDADGRYVLEGLPVDRRYSLSVEAAGYGVSGGRVKPLVAGQRNAADPIVLVWAGKVIAGRVVDKAGKPKAGVSVCINSAQTGVQTVTSDPAGRFRFKVVGGATPLIWLRDEDGQSQRSRGVRAGQEDLELVYDPAQVRP